MKQQLRRPDDIAALVKVRREAAGLTQQVLADRLGVSRRWISRMENGWPRVQLDLVLRCLNELDILVFAVDPQSADQGIAPAGAGRRAILDIDAIADHGYGAPVKRRSR